MASNVQTRSETSRQEGMFTTLFSRFLNMPRSFSQFVSLQQCGRTLILLTSAGEEAKVAAAPVG